MSKGVSLLIELSVKSPFGGLVRCTYWKIRICIVHHEIVRDIFNWSSAHKSTAIHMNMHKLPWISIQDTYFVFEVLRKSDFMFLSSRIAANDGKCYGFATVDKSLFLLLNSEIPR